ncbi:hypothetical protein [Ligilactobacillus aviarius]|uniref:hypothetical protein n=1 Tax=Ligilactobacillus aviarius TaxID=1606 RepID=UPI0024B9B0C5|nr:hypothetical protein [Ligilactobacillus aviarius]
MREYIKKHRSKIILELIFILLAILFVLPFVSHGFIPAGDDLGYHFDRVIEIADNFKHGNFFPQMYTYTFYRFGYLLNSFYPWLTIVPFAIFKNIFSNQVISFAWGSGLYIFAGLNITYHVSNELFKNKVQSFFTALIYIFSGYLLTDGYSRFAFGEFIAMIFIPACFYGFYAVLFGNKKDWPYLAFGMSAIMLSHVLSTFIVTMTFTILFVVLFHWINDRKERIKRLAFAVGVFITSSAIFLLPFVQQELYQKFAQPSPMPLSGPNFGDNIISALNSNNGDNLGFIIISVLILGLIFWKALNKLEKSCYVIGTIVLAFTTSLFPWTMLTNTFLDVIQFTFRFDMVITILYAVVAGKIVRVVLDKIFAKNNDRIKKSLVSVGALLIILVPWLGDVTNILNYQMAGTPEQYRFTKSYKLFTDQNGLWMDQYTPEKGQSALGGVTERLAIVDGNQVQLHSKDIKSLPNGLKFTGNLVDSAKSVILPTYNYKNIHVYRNGKQIKWSPNSQDLIQVDSGSGPITVKYVLSFVDWLAIILSFATWIIALVMYVRRKRITE